MVTLAKLFKKVRSKYKKLKKQATDGVFHDVKGKERNSRGYFNEDTANPNDYIGNYMRVFVKGHFFRNSLECPNCEIHVKLKGKAMPLDPVEENVSTGFEVNITAGHGPSSNQAS